MPAGMISNVACIGGGTIGCGWAVVFAMANKNAYLYDRNKAVMSGAADEIQRCIRDIHSVRSDSGGYVSRGRIVLCDSLEQAVSDADYIQESIGENVSGKRAVFRDIAEHAKSSAIIGSSSSSIPGSAFMGPYEISSRALVVHPVNPPFAIPVVELCRTKWTTSGTYNTVKHFMESVGMIPVEIKKEIPGFVINRLQIALLTEALFLIEKKVVDPRDLDTCVTQGLGLRWSFLGPLKTAQLNSGGSIQDYMQKFGAAIKSLACEIDSGYDWHDETLVEIDRDLNADIKARLLDESARNKTIIQIRQYLADHDPNSDA
jgi:3-hydroxyacyl-CoA dehydrogenase